MILTGRSGKLSCRTSLTSVSSAPLYILPSSPSAHETVTSAPSFSASVALPQPTTAGTPSSRDNGGMTGASAAVRHNRRRAFHHRLPIGIGHIGHQHVPWHHARHLRGIADDPR